MKTYPAWDSIPRLSDGEIPESIEKYAVHCVNSYPKLVEYVKLLAEDEFGNDCGWIIKRDALDLLGELGEL